MKEIILIVSFEKNSAMD